MTRREHAEPPLFIILYETFALSSVAGAQNLRNKTHLIHPKVTGLRCTRIRVKAPIPNLIEIGPAIAT